MHPALQVALEPLNVAAAKLLQNEGETTTLPLLAQPWGAGNSPALGSADFRTGGQGRCHCPLPPCRLLHTHLTILSFDYQKKIQIFKFFIIINVIII